MIITQEEDVQCEKNADNKKKQNTETEQRKLNTEDVMKSKCSLYASNENAPTRTGPQIQYETTEHWKQMMKTEYSS